LTPESIHGVVVKFFSGDPFPLLHSDTWSHYRSPI